MFALLIVLMHFQHVTDRHSIHGTAVPMRPCIITVYMFAVQKTLSLVVCCSGFVVISCDEDDGGWCDLTDHSDHGDDPFPTLINFADRTESLTG